jgi:hypothetical protein
MFAAPRLGLGMRKRAVTATVLIFFAWALVIATHVLHPDGLAGAFIGSMLHVRTHYAPAYTFKGFQSVRVGMTTNDVRTLLGSPLDQWREPEKHRECWRYSDDKFGEDYRVRAVIFSNGVVVSKESYLYVD